MGHLLQYLEKMMLNWAGGKLAAQRPGAPGGGCISQNVLGSKLKNPNSNSFNNEKDFYFP